MSQESAELPDGAEPDSAESDSPESSPSGLDPDPGFYDRALRRIPRWMVLAAAVALPFVWWHGGALWAASFVTGAIGGYWNYVGICRVVEKFTQTAEQPGVARPSAAGPVFRSIIRVLFIAAAAFVIIRFTHISLAAAFLGLLTPVGAVVLEILYELFSTESWKKSG